MLTISFICSFFFLSSQIFCYRFLGFYESQGLQISYIPWEWPSILWDRKPRCWDLFLPSFSISHSKVIHMEVVSKISQELLRRGFWNLVQMLGMTCCIVLKRICLLLLIISFICPFFFLSSKTFHHRILRSYYSQSLQILYTPWEGQVYCGKENQDSVINICLIFPFFLFFHLFTPV